MQQLVINNQLIKDSKIMNIIKKITLVPKKGSKWFADNGLTFTVVDVIEKNNEMWVRYKNDTNEYSCLMPAFTSRFVENINY